VLCDALGVEEDAQHNYLDFRDIPDAIGIQIHRPREPNFQKFLKDNGFRPVVMLRHPLFISRSVKHDLGMFQALPNKRGWQGRFGLWRDIMPSRHTQLIYERHKALFNALGYGVPETELDVRSNWIRLCR